MANAKIEEYRKSLIENRKEKKSISDYFIGARWKGFIGIYENTAQICIQYIEY